MKILNMTDEDFVNKCNARFCKKLHDFDIVLVTV